jgi:hypothetical protein
VVNLIIKLTIIVITEIIASVLMILLECLNLKKKFIPINKNKGINVKIAGYILNAAINSP